MRVILVCGVPGSGKSTVARALSEKTGLLLLAKDRVMESLADCLDRDLTPEFQRELGPLSMHLLFSILESQPQSTSELLFDAPFWHAEAWQSVRKRLLVHPGIALSVILCMAPAETIISRIAARQPTRHPVHPRNRLLSAEEWTERQVRIGRWIDELELPKLTLDTSSQSIAACAERAVVFLAAGGRK